MASETRATLAHITKLSDLLELGLADLRKQEEAPNSRVDMHVWLKQNGECVACLAGSVMRFTLGINLQPGGYENARDFKDWKQLIALDRLRTGYVHAAASLLGVQTILPPLRLIANYDRDHDGWWGDINELLADLRRAGE